MSISYSIDSVLDLSYTEENIKYVLSSGMEQGFVYLEDESRKVLSISHVIQKILFDSENIVNHITTKFKDTIFFIWFFKTENNLLIFSIGSFGYRWDKEFNNGVRQYTIDFARYIYLILQVCRNITLLELCTVGDEIENIIYDESACITAMLDIADFDSQKLEYISDGKLSVRSFLVNIIQNGFIVEDNLLEQNIEIYVHEYYEKLKKNSPLYLYVKKDNIPFKIEIKPDIQGYDLVSIYPLARYFMKKGYGSEKEKINIAFYIQRLLELCENFAIYELKTYF